jgi:multidrug efflux pump subunit AcrA (membrane-fusion protein)
VWPFPLLLIGGRSMYRRRERAEIARRVLGAIAFTALALAGCGGSGSGPGGDGGTQPGGAQTYTVTVTATGTNAATHSTQFTLTVTS